MWQLIWLISTIAIINLVSFRLVVKLLQKREVVASNCRQKQIPYGYGLVFTIVFTLSSLLGALVGEYQFSSVNQLLVLVLTMSLVGVIDDLIGSTETQGLEGHFKSLVVSGYLTTGALKAGFSSFIIIVNSLYWYASWGLGLLNSFIFLLTANFINLLDLKPGRALKVVFILSSITIIIYPQSLNWGLLLLIAVLFALPFDLGEQGMMGDTGANVLGVTLGFLIVISLSTTTKLFWSGFLILVHIYTEFHSLSSLIASNSVLNYLDQLGRLE